MRSCLPASSLLRHLLGGAGFRGCVGPPTVSAPSPWPTDIVLPAGLPRSRGSSRAAWATAPAAQGAGLPRSRGSSRAAWAAAPAAQGPAPAKDMVLPAGVPRSRGSTRAALPLPQGTLQGPPPAGHSPPPSIGSMTCAGSARTS